MIEMLIDFESSHLFYLLYFQIFNPFYFLFKNENYTFQILLFLVIV